MEKLLLILLGGDVIWLFYAAPTPIPGIKWRNSCCKLAVIFCAPYALPCFVFCSNDCLSAEYAGYYFGSAVCSGRSSIHNPKVGGSIPPPATITSVFTELIVTQQRLLFSPRGKGGTDRVRFR